MAPRYRVTLTSEERAALERMTKDGKTLSKRYLHARVLLLSDVAGGPGWPVKDIALALGVTPRTVEHLKKRFVEEGLDCALDRRPEAKPRAVRFGGEFEARLIALACTEPPAGRARWTVRLLADKAVELSIADSVSPMTVCNTLKKTNFSLTARHTGKSRPTEMRPS